MAPMFSHSTFHYRQTTEDRQTNGQHLVA